MARRRAGTECHEVTDEMTDPAGFAAEKGMKSFAISCADMFGAQRPSWPSSKTSTASTLRAAALSGENSNVDPGARPDIGMYPKNPSVKDAATQ